MQDDHQIFLPPSFTALYSDTRGRLRATAAQLCARYELCEDLANHLVEQAQQLYHGAVPSEEEVLRRIHAGIAGAESGVRTSSGSQHFQQTTSIRSSSMLSGKTRRCSMPQWPHGIQ